MPTRTARNIGSPASKAPAITLNGWPKITTTEINSTCCQYSTSMAGSSSIPTDTKKIAPKRSFTGRTKCSIRSACTVSASNAPMMKAPNAALKPVFTANTTMERQSATATISSVSSFISFRVRAKSVGIRNTPAANHRIRKKPSLPSSQSIAPPEKCWLTARLLNSTNSSTATMSSITSTPTTTPANTCVFSPSSFKARTMIVVLEIERIPPKNRLSMAPQPNHCPVR